MKENRSLRFMEFSIPVGPPVGVAVNSLEGMRPPSCSLNQNFRFDRLNRCLWRLDRLCGAVQLELNPRALDVLEELLKQPHEWVSKIDIMTTVWGRPVEDAALYVQIYNLRKKLSQKRQPGQKAPPSCIQTKSGRGYRLLARVIPIDTRGTSTCFTPLDERKGPITLIMLSLGVSARPEKPVILALPKCRHLVAYGIRHPARLIKSVC